MSPDEFAEAVSRYFGRVHREVFTGDPASNPSLEVEVIGAQMAHDTPIVVLLAPWTLCGLALPPDGRLPDTLRVNHQPKPVLTNEVDAIGRYATVVLVPDVSGYVSQEDARIAARSLVDDFSKAVRRSREERTGVADPERRSLLRAGSTGHPRSNETRSAFGAPDDAAPVPKST